MKTKALTAKTRRREEKPLMETAKRTNLLLVGKNLSKIISRSAFKQIMSFSASSRLHGGLL